MKKMNEENKKIIQKERKKDNVRLESIDINCYSWM